MEESETSLETLRKDALDEDYVLTVVSIFFLWASAVTLGKVAKCVFLPPLLGMLISGILFGNVPGMKGFLLINKSWEESIRKIAFLLILIRAGMGINPEVLKRSLKICFLLGFGSTAVEVLGIALMGHFAMGVPAVLALAFSYVLTSTSPAITVPTMIRLQREERGAENGIPTVILASATIDNLHCITVFYIILGLMSSENGITSTVIQVVSELVSAGIFGIFFGFFLRFFPDKKNGFFHFFRATVTLVLALAVYYGSTRSGFNIVGPVTVFLMCITASKKWKYDNPEKTKKEERGFRILWAFVFQPLLFSLIGLLFDFSVFNLKLLIQALILLLIGIFIRIFSVFLISFFVKIKPEERGFMAICFCPKATVQAALAPTLASFAILNPNFSDFSELILQTNILSILISAPIGQLVILGLGRILLPKPNKNESTVSTGESNNAMDTDSEEDIEVQNEKNNL